MSQLSASTSATPTHKAAHIGLWVAQVLLAAAFGMAGVAKTTTPIPELAAQMKWVGEVSPALVRVIGTVELLGALGLILPSALRIAPKLTPLAAAGLTTVMILASTHHARMGDGPETFAINAVLGTIAAVIAYGRLRVAPIRPR